MTTMTKVAAGDPARTWAEAVLAEYPQLSSAELEALIRWFRKDASALDVAMIASNEAIAEPYRRFRAEQIDPVTGRDLIHAALFALAVIGAVGLIIWRVM